MSQTHPMRGQSTPKKLLVFKAPRVGSMSRANELGEEVGSTIRVHESDNAESNAEQFLVLGLHGLGE